MITSFKTIIGVLFTTAFLSFLVSPIYLIAFYNEKNFSNEKNNSTDPGSDTPDSFFPTLTNINNPTTPYELGAIASDRAECGVMGTEILKKGNAFDAAIITGLCQGIYNAFSSGIGGGAAILIRTKEGETFHIDAREKAPLGASENMYIGHLDYATRGGLALAVPGELLGYYELFEKYGSKVVSWGELLQPIINLARNGYVVNKLTADRILSAESHDTDHTRFPEFWKIYGNLDGSRKKVGDTIKNENLAQTFEKIAENGISIFYNGSLANDIVLDIQEQNGIITLEDLRQYNVVWRKPLETWYHGHKVYGTQPPISGGPCIALALNILEYYNLPQLFDNGEYPLAIHWLVEALKFAYADRFALGDPLFIEKIDEYLSAITSKDHASKLRQRLNPNKTFSAEHYKDLFQFNSPDDHGTSHWSVYDKFGNSVSITSTINLNYGSLVVGKRTGILFNDQMDDFSTPNTTNSFGFPASPNNYIHPGKRPLSSMSPTIVTKNDKPFIITGGSGGSTIISGTLQVILNLIAFRRTSNEAVSSPRIHHQLLPNILAYEPNYSSKVISRLSNEGNYVQSYQQVGNVEQAILIDTKGLIWPASDWRKGGAPSGY